MAKSDALSPENSPVPVYEGTEVLEIMEAAENYNAALCDLVTSYAPADGVIVDFGAGRGTFARRLVAAGYRVQCIESDAALRAKLEEDGFAAAESLSEIDHASIDYVYTLNVLEHITDDREVLIALRECLRPGGCLLIYVPAFPILYSNFDRSVGHVRRYRARELAARVREAGLLPLDVRYYDSLGFFAALVAKWTAGENATLSRRGLVLYDRLVFPLSRVLDRCCRRFFGKNLVVIARRPME